MPGGLRVKVEQAWVGKFVPGACILQGCYSLSPMPASVSLGKQRSNCPLSGSLEILGDKWTLLVVRDFFRGYHRYKEFQQSPEGIPTNILADRLKRLLKHGIVERRVYQRNPTRYDYYLTMRGLDLLDVMLALSHWSSRHIRGLGVAPTREQVLETLHASGYARML